MRRKPEILAPAGDMEKLQMAVLYGADAVYLAGTSFGMRSFAGNFTPEELPKAVKFAHDHSVRVHVTVNTMPRNDEVARLPEHLERLNDAGVDGKGSVFTGNSRNARENSRGAGGRDLLSRRDVRELFGPLPSLKLHDRPRLEPRPVRPALPLPVRADGGETSGRIFPRLRG